MNNDVNVSVFSACVKILARITPDVWALGATEDARRLNHHSTSWWWPRRDGTAGRFFGLTNAMLKEMDEITNFRGSGAGRKWRHGVSDGLDGCPKSRSIRRRNSRDSIRRRSRVIAERLAFPVSWLAGATSVSALF